MKEELDVVPKSRKAAGFDEILPEFWEEKQSWQYISLIILHCL